MNSGSSQWGERWALSLFKSPRVNSLFASLFKNPSLAHAPVRPTHFSVEDSYTVQIPQHFELETTQLLQDDMRNGKCKISVPAVTRSVFG